LLDLGPEAQSLQQQIIRRLVRTVNQDVDELFVHLLVDYRTEACGGLRG
jgi:hypothetical protein